MTRRSAKAAASRPAALGEPTHHFRIPAALANQYTEPYGVSVAGDCLAPLVNDGDWLMAAVDGPRIENLPVIVYPKTGKPFVKVLQSAPLFGWRLPGPGSNLMPAVGLAMLNPPSVMYVPLDAIEAVHGVIGVVVGSGKTHEVRRFDLNSVAAPRLAGRTTP